MDKRKKNEIIQQGFDFEVLYNWDCLQRIASHPKYKKLYEYLEFDSDGFAVTDLLGRDSTKLDSDWKNFKVLAYEEYEKLKRDNPSKAAKYLTRHSRQEEEFLKNLFGEENNKIAL